MTNTDLAVGVMLEKRPKFKEVTKNMPHKKRIRVKKHSESLQKSLSGINKFICEICHQESASQFDFYNHLKIHYENTHEENIELENKKSNCTANRLDNFKKEELKKLERLQDSLDLNSKDVILVIPEDILDLESCQENDINDECDDLKEALKPEDVLHETNSIAARVLLDPVSDIKIKPDDISPKVAKKIKAKSDKKYPCNSCGKTFLSSAAKTVHQRIHSDSRPFPCSGCDLSFRQLGDLKYHKQSKHSQLPEFQCEFCGKEFARKYSLTLHRKIHTGELSHHCDYCDKSFRAAVYLQNHRRIHTGEKPFPCTKCSKRFRVKADINRHMKVHAARELKGMARIECCDVARENIAEDEIECCEAEKDAAVNQKQLLDHGLLNVRMVLN